ncbi:hypothetical protein ABT337_07490 [Saccharopolyspora hirsuta]|uniref:Uncharacterized protein n=1 Tax=Saccharopolyspora hirsuta TaxID=1837 RepID=A0A5M7C029_SACHI|nr:hypothetical protein [Saccharopolyspora hirsuta]KAA5835093.1 hypothetical protein F1721_09860 [Saccharopolyspora hirsuta]
MSDAERRRMQHLVGQLRRSVDSLVRNHDNCLSARRLHNAVERLELDLAAECPRSCAAEPSAQAVVLVPDEPYDPDLWRDADDEGIGGFRRAPGAG